MKQSKVVKLLESCGAKLSCEPWGKFRQRWHAKGAKNYADWYFDLSSEEVVVLSVHQNGTQDDIMTDYFCGVYPKTLKRLKEFFSE